MKLATKTIAILALLAVQSFAAEVKIQADRWMPLNGTPHEDPPGFAIEMLVAVFTDVDDLTYTLEPFGDAIAATNTGKAHAVIGAAKDEAPNLIYPKEPVFRYNPGLWAKKGSSFSYSPENLTKVKIGIIKGYTYWPELDKMIKDNAPNLVVFSGDEPLQEAINALEKGEIDIYPEAIAVFNWALKERKIDPSLYETKYRHEGEPVFVAFTPSTRGKELADKWDERIAEIRKNGVLAEILKKYDVADWK